ncbi:MAG TPA: hypothetical protein VG872_12695 [Acidimicrobiia bacterium]|jgi:hypothetical protein|nr:hypothetical protein [Acidimicrobiia bacterium]
MTHDQIDRLVRQANPVADLKALEPVDTSALLVARQRRMRMQTNDRIQVDQEPGKPKRGLFMGIAAVVAMIIGAVIIFQMTDETPVADDGPSPNSAADVETATAFLQAFGSFDADTAASYLAVDVLDSEFGGLEGLRLETAFWEAQGFRLLIGACEAGDVSPVGTAVACSYDYHGIRSDEMGLGPYEGSKWNFTILDGKIISASNYIRFIENGFSAQVWEPFDHWVSQNHPEDAAIMYADASHTMQRISEESNRLWEQRSREYVEVVAIESLPERDKVDLALAFMAAWVAGDGETAAGMFNGDGRYGAGVVGPDQLRLLHEWYQAVGWKFENLGCRAEPVATPNGEVVVGCDFTSENDLSRSLDWPHITDEFHVVVDGDGLQHATERFGFDAYRDLWFMFKDWVASTHPNDLERMFLHPTQPWPGVRTLIMPPPFEALNAYPLLSEESIALWELYVEEFTGSTEALAQADEELEVAHYVAQAVAICTAADSAFRAEVAGLMHSETQNFEQFFPGFPDLESVASWHETQARYAEGVIAELRVLSAPAEIASRLDQLFQLMETETELNRQVAEAAAAGDQGAVDALGRQRVDATHAKDQFAVSTGNALWSCPVSIAGA